MARRRAAGCGRARGGRKATAGSRRALEPVADERAEFEVSEWRELRALGRAAVVLAVQLAYALHRLQQADQADAWLRARALVHLRLAPRLDHARPGLEERPRRARAALEEAAKDWLRQAIGKHRVQQPAQPAEDELLELGVHADCVRRAKRVVRRVCE